MSNYHRFKDSEILKWTFRRKTVILSVSFVRLLLLLIPSRLKADVIQPYSVPRSLAVVK